MKKFKFVLTIFLLFIIYCYITFYISIPEKVFLMDNEKMDLKIVPGINLIETTMTNNSNFSNGIENIDQFEDKEDIKEDINYTNVEH